MGMTRYNWSAVDPDIIGGMSDKQVSEKHGIPSATIYYHRVNQLGIVTKLVLDRREANGAFREPASKSSYYATALPEIVKQSAERKRENMGLPEDFFYRVWMPGPAGRQFLEALR